MGHNTIYPVTLSVSLHDLFSLSLVNWTMLKSNNDCIYITILKATFNRKPLILSSDITVGPTCNATKTILKSIRAWDWTNASE